MKRLFTITLVILALTLSVSSASCSSESPTPEGEQPIIPDDDSDDDSSNEGDNNNPMSNNLKITVGSVSFNATLDSNATTTAFKALLPMTINMSEMNGNEKYYYLSEGLPTASSNPGSIRSGDLMLYGSTCVVLFYETFSTSYSYTRLGRVDNPSKLASALGSGNVTVTFETTNN